MLLLPETDLTVFRLITVSREAVLPGPPPCYIALDNEAVKQHLRRDAVRYLNLQDCKLL